MEDEIIDFVLPRLNMVDNTLFNPIIKDAIDNFGLDKIKDKKQINDAIYIAGKLGYIQFSGNTRISGKLTTNGYYLVKEGGYLKYLSKNRDKEQVSVNNIYTNVSQVIHGSHFGSSNIQATNNENTIPQPNDKKSKLHIRIWNLITENKLISTILAAIILTILAYFGITISK